MRRTLAFVLVVTAQTTLSTAQTTSSTRLIPYAGTVVDASGRPTSGPSTLTFELYEDQEGGAPLWQEVQRVQGDDRGRYLVYLGTIVSLPQVAFSEERARWLAVTADGRALPRVMLVAVPYALRAADADTLGGQPASSFVRSRADGRLETSAGLVAAAAVEGTGVPGQLAKFSSATTVTSSTIAETSSNRIGVRTTDPTGSGVVDSVFTIRNQDNNTGFAVLNQTHQRRFALNTLTNGGWTLYDGGNGTWNQGLNQRNGLVGIGMPVAPNQAHLQVRNSFARPAIHANAISQDNQAIRGFSSSASVVILGLVSPTDIAWGIANGAGVMGINDIGGTGVFGQTTTGTLINSGIVGRATGTGTGVYGNSLGGGLAGHFAGDVTVTGMLAKGGGSFTIDHPLDPTNKYLSHSFVESPDMMNVYNGNITLDANGEACVALPEWFEALNRDFRYQLTAIGAPGPNLYVASEVSGNRFKIAGGTPNGRVSWQITGVRQDAWANAHRIAVEENKPASERGSYLHPKEHGQTERRSSQ